MYRARTGHVVLTEQQIARLDNANPAWREQRSDQNLAALAAYRDSHDGQFPPMHTNLGRWLCTLASSPRPRTRERQLLDEHHPGWSTLQPPDTTDWVALLDEYRLEHPDSWPYSRSSLGRRLYRAASGQRPLDPASVVALDERHPGWRRNHPTYR
jgi:hypothetical protein